MPRLLLLLAVLSFACSGLQPAQKKGNDAQCYDFEESDGTFVAVSDPGQILIEGVESFDVDGLPVLLKPTPGKPVLSAGLYVLGGTANLTPETAGIEELMMGVVTSGGSLDYPRQQLSAELDTMGSAIGNSAGRAYSVFGLQSLTMHWDRSFELFADVLLHPAFPPEELEIQRTRQIEFLKRLDESSNRYITILGHDLLFEGHPYAIRHWGTIPNVERLTIDALKAYHQKLMVKSRLLFVVVGDISRADLEAKIRATFATLPQGSYTPPILPELGTFEPRYGTFDVPNLATSYLRAFFKAPPPGHPDYYPLVAATAILSNRFFEKIRTKLNLSYSVYAGISSLPVNYGSIYLSSPQPMRTLAQMYDEIESMQDWLVGERELSDQVELFITQFLLDLETQGAQRDILADAQLLMGDYAHAGELIMGLRAVTPLDVRRVMQRYIRNLQVGYYGEPAVFDAELLSSEPAHVDALMTERARELKALLDAPPSPPPTESIDDTSGDVK